MKKVKIISEGINHRALDLGAFDELIDYSYLHPKRNQEVKGKVFLGEMLNSTSAEISFTVIPANTEMPFMHQHKNHEEIYVILKGCGQFQVDDSVFEITEGSVIRISPNGKRIYRNNTAYPLVFLCIQNQAGSLDSFQVEDGFLVEGKIAWKK
jgi:mannose-6-phosphate isomerase-like protein (cupin superfamily)